MTDAVLLVDTSTLEEPVRAIALVDLRDRPGELFGALVEALENAGLTTLAPIQGLHIATPDHDESAHAGA